MKKIALQWEISWLNFWGAFYTSTLALIFTGRVCQTSYVAVRKWVILKEKEFEVPPLTHGLLPHVTSASLILWHLLTSVFDPFYLRFKDLWITFSVHPDNPGQSSHRSIIDLITFANSLLLYKVLFIGPKDQEVNIFGGPLFSLPLTACLCPHDVG